jgi:hypothetical protein
MGFQEIPRRPQVPVETSAVVQEAHPQEMDQRVLGGGGRSFHESTGFRCHRIGLAFFSTDPTREGDGP